MIRPATPDDTAAIRSCAESAFARYIDRIGRRPAPMDADIDAQIAASHVHVATHRDGAFQGYIVFTPENDHMHLDSIAVLPDAAGRGIGKALIAFCESTAQQRGLKAVHLHTNAMMTENLSIYPRLGYAEVARRRDDGFDRVFFEKPLSPAIR